jgi:hypothetical protein
LNGTVLGSFVRPAVLITDAYNALNNQGYRKKQDQDFIGKHSALDLLLLFRFFRFLQFLVFLSASFYLFVMS